MTEPGCRKVKITPHLCGMTYAHGTYPTPYGKITVTHYLRDDGSVKSDILLPEGVELDD